MTKPSIPRMDTTQDVVDILTELSARHAVPKVAVITKALRVLHDLDTELQPRDMELILRNRRRRDKETKVRIEW